MYIVPNWSQVIDCWSKKPARNRKQYIVTYFEFMNMIPTKTIKTDFIPLTMNNKDGSATSFCDAWKP